MFAFIAAAIVAASVAPSPTFPGSPAPVETIAAPTPTPAERELSAYKPIPCPTLIRKARLAGRTIDADHLGSLFAEALRAHGVTPNGTIPMLAVAKAELDFNACFHEAK